ncbi:MAG: OmpA family protein, partial [bacterium]|nr:OmpA family protein [bacterium]
KYYDFDAVIYKDLNGNRVHDINEPGVSNILTEIRKVDKTFENEKVSYGSSKELLSNTEGQISYINLAEGNYIINYIPQTDILGSYISETSTKEFKADRDTFLHIPFMEKNKVFGRVTLHRAKRSGLGDIPLDNIKIIVEGGEKTYSDLTDKNGYFELYIPVTDYYKVTINNIFYENFNIRQEYFLVKFNGYKQFEVSFDFDEKERKITGIDDSDFAIDDDGELKLEDVKVLRQTNLKGVVRDANSLKPIHANIIVTNSNTGELISETASSLKTGAYFTNFFSGKGYMLKVESKGYWTQSEMLEINQITTFENITRDIILSPITKGEVIELNNQRFASSSSEITPAAKLELENVIIRLIKNPTVKIEVQGHTDNVEALNSDAVKLSENRAKAVINYLSSRGVQPNRMRFKGMGDRRSVASNDSQSGRARNRRVELIVTDF